MKLSLKHVFVVVLILGWVAAAAAQNSTFSRNGASFDYPEGWVIQDASNNNSDELTLANASLDVQLKVTLFKTPLTTPEKLAEAKKVLVERYTAGVMKFLADAGGKPESGAATSQIAGLPAESTRIKASLDGAAGGAEIVWAVINDRMVVLTLLGPDTDVKSALPAWNMVRATMQIQKPTPPPAAPPKKH